MFLKSAWQVRKHCFLAMFLKGGQTRKICQKEKSVFGKKTVFLNLVGNISHQANCVCK